MRCPFPAAVLCFLLGLLLAPVLLSAGPNVSAQLGLAVVSSPCGLRKGDLIEFFVAVRHMSQVRQLKFDFSWQPADAVVDIVGKTAGVAAEKSFLAPGPPQIEGNRAEYGMATFGAGLEGEGILARFVFELSGTVDARTPVDIRLEQLSLGPSSTERDTVLPFQALVLGNYCDSSGQPVARGLFVRPREERVYFSSPSTGRLADNSAGEVLLSARFLDDGLLLPEQTVTWNIDNPGTVPFYVLAATDALLVEPGDTRLGYSRSDVRGDAYLLLDAEPGLEFAAAVASLTACTESAGETHCAAAEVVWESRATAVTSAAGPALPGQLRLEQNYPNPFNAGTTIPLAVPSGHLLPLRLDILNLAGQVVDVLLAEPLPAGFHQIRWDGRSQRGGSLASGHYFCRLRSGTAAQVRSVILLR